MEKITKTDLKLKKSRIYTKEQELADQIYSYFGKKIKFGLIMNKILNCGYQYIYECFNEVKQSNPKNREALFMWKAGQVKINFNTNIRQTK